MFRTDLLSIIRSLNTVFTAIGFCNVNYVDCLLARSGWNWDLAVFLCIFFVLYCHFGLIQFLFGILILIYLFCLLGIDEFDIQKTVPCDIFS
jgi:hypothetical protein